MELSALALVGIFFSGLALNLTPCVYPMLSVTVALFGGRREKHLLVAFGKALLYVLGMAVMYSALGVFAALTGGFFGAAIQNPWMLVVMALVMFLLALGMFDLYEFRAPSRFLDWAGGKRRGGALGVFLSGLFVGIFAAPCIGPPIVALLALVGQSMNPVSGFLAFFVLALGLGLPYLILGTFSGLLSKLPKSGDWLLWVKKAFGIILLGLSLFYLSLALYADFLPYVVPVTLTVGGIYLGFIERSGNKSKLFRGAKHLSATLAVILAGVLLMGKPPAGVVWEPYTVEKVSLAKTSGQAVVIDFFADWCLPCHELERYTYTDPEVIRALEPFVRLKADVTNPKTEEAMEPVDRFEILGVPTVLFLDRKGKEVPGTRITGYAPPREFLKSVELLADQVKHETG